MNNKVVHDYIFRRIQKIKCRNISNVEWASLKDEIVFLFWVHYFRQISFTDTMQESLDVT